MKEKTSSLLDNYAGRHPFVQGLKDDIKNAFKLILKCYAGNGKVLVCGNGGSNADADHIVGELLKGFRYKRPLSSDYAQKYEQFGETGMSLARKLQGSLSAINLGSHTSLITAVINDIGSEEVFAQQVVGFGNKEDVLIGISTSGNAKNVINACIVAKTKGLKTIALTGMDGGRMNDFFDVLLCMPSRETADIQDMHSVVYHILCAMIESEIWDE